MGTRQLEWKATDMATPDDLLTQLRAAHRQVFDGCLDAVDGLDEAGWATPTGCPGWDVHDQLAHVIGVERTMLGDPADEVELPELAHVRNDLGRFVEVAVQARRGQPGAALVAEAQETFARRLDALDAMEPAALGAELAGPGGMRVKGSQMLRTRVFDMTCHEQDIRRALGRPGGTAGPHVDIAVEQVLRAWVRHLPRAIDPEGVLEVRVAGRSPVSLSFPDGAIHRDDAVVASTATSRPDPVASPPTATIHLGVADLLAVAGGRTDAPSPAEVSVEGDRPWALRVLEHATITP
ncbi:MAG: maleylpyruvate isomerase family mycothiol-dependent enzyme [Actinomycetota bacterium]